MTTHLVHPQPRRTPQRAFSLVEVVLALGIMSFALTAIIGLLPVGLSHYQKAIDLTLQAQIGQEVVSIVQRTPYEDIQTFGDESNPTTWFYDIEGTLLPPDREDEYTFKAEIYQASNAEMNDMLAPAWTRVVDGTPLNSVKAVKISISNRVMPGKINTRTTYVPNTGR